MFTGIIKALGVVKNVERRAGSAVLYITTPKGMRVHAGDSIATNGACLTVEKVSRGYYQCRLMATTLLGTSFGASVPPVVNLEPSLKVGGTLDGHLVTGHVDAIGTISSVHDEDGSRILTVDFPPKYQRLVARKGSIALNGVSLTVADVSRGCLTVALVAYTLNHTTLGGLTPGDTVNLEFDVIAKYLAVLIKK